MATTRTTTTTSTLARLKAELLADRRKAAVLTVLAAMALVLTLRLLLGRHTPRRAVARPTPSATAAQAPGAAKESPTVESALPERLAQVDTTITRDLFAVHMAAYPLLPASDQPGGAPAGGPSSDPALRAREQVTQAAMKLRLQSAIPGPRPTAIISGVVVGVGDRVPDKASGKDTGFIVQSIEQGSCVVTRQGVAVRLNMQN